jgi:hypothetical protein
LSIEVPTVGCVERFPILEAHAAVSGSVSTDDGKPAAKIRVELLRKNRRGEWYSTSQMWKQTDQKGQFRFDDLPDGDYLLGNGIWHDKPSNFSSYATTYFPGVSDRARASVIHLVPLQTKTNLSFSLPKPDTPRTIHVEVVWPDGHTPEENLLQLFDGDDLLKNVGGTVPNVPIPSVPHNGIVEFAGYVERAYDLNVRYWVDDPGGPVPHDQERIARSDVVHLLPGKEPASVRLVLTRTLLADQDH